MTNPRIHPSINLAEITARNETARRIIAGFSAEMPALTGIWQTLRTALTDTQTLTAELTRLSAEVSATRRDMADLLAAARATLAAHSDGEADPLYYLRDELDARQTPPERHGRPS